MDVLTTIATVASAIAAIASVFVAIIVGTNQKKSEKRSQDIELFDKRYDVYRDFVRIFQYSSFVQEETLYTLSRDGRSNNLYILNRILQDYELPSGKSFTAKLLEINRMLKEGSNSEEMTAINDEDQLERQVTKEIIPIRVSLENKMKSAEFLYTKEISNAAVGYVTALFDYLVPFSNRSDNYRQLKGSIENINDTKIIDKMRETIDFSIKE